jgi:serine/threonine-protein phosphatase 2A activator
MLKMYHAEVLGKLPVVQHFLFGEILRWEGPWPVSSNPSSSSSLSHDHGHNHGGGETGWGDCCGIPVPSVFGAAAEKEGESKVGMRLGGAGIRPVPFD